MSHPDSLITVHIDICHDTPNTLWYLKIVPLYARFPLLYFRFLDFWELRLTSLSTLCTSAVWGTLLTISEACWMRKEAFALSKGQKKNAILKGSPSCLEAVIRHIKNLLCPHSPQNLVLPLNDNLNCNPDGILNIYWTTLSVTEGSIDFQDCLEFGWYSRPFIAGPLSLARVEPWVLLNSLFSTPQLHTWALTHFCAPGP